MATAGRHELCERSLSLFLNQDYPEAKLLIFQNSDVPQILDPTVDKNKVILINQYIDSKTNEPYTNLGAIYNDALKYVPDDTDLITHWDDDDLFLPDHISKGVEGYIGATLRSNRPYKAYKPERSYFRHANGIDLTGNTLEPSIFVEANHIREYEYSLTTTEQHLQWYHALGNDLYVDPNGKPTLIYNWGDSIPTFKTSGDFGNPNNFNNYRTFSQRHGDGIITPHDVSEYYDLIK